MPIYEYRCQQCGTRFEKLIRSSAEQAELACPACGHKQLTLELSVFAAPRSSSTQQAQPPTCPAVGGPCCGPGACGLE